MRMSTEAPAIARQIGSPALLGSVLDVKDEIARVQGDEALGKVGGRGAVASLTRAGERGNRRRRSSDLPARVALVNMSSEFPGQTCQADCADGQLRSAAHGLLHLWAYACGDGRRRRRGVRLG